jgi:hypothetical protein
MRLVSNPIPPHRCDITDSMSPEAFSTFSRQLGSQRDLLPGAVVECPDCKARWKYMGIVRDRGATEHHWAKIPDVTGNLEKIVDR